MLCNVPDLVTADQILIDRFDTKTYLSPIIFA